MKPGDRVQVKKLSPNDGVFVEGMATIVRIVSQQQHGGIRAKVAFDDEPMRL